MNACNVINYISCKGGLQKRFEEAFDTESQLNKWKIQSEIRILESYYGRKVKRQSPDSVEGLD